MWFILTEVHSFFFQSQNFLSYQQFTVWLWAIQCSGTYYRESNPKLPYTRFSWKSTTAHRCPSNDNADRTQHNKLSCRLTWDTESNERVWVHGWLVWAQLPQWEQSPGWVGDYNRCRPVGSRRERDILKLGLEPKLFLVFWENVASLESQVKWALARREFPATTRTKGHELGPSCLPLMRTLWGYWAPQMPGSFPISKCLT